MRAARLHPGYEVEVKFLGRRFPAVITGKPAGGRVPIKPLTPNVSYRSVAVRHVSEVLHRQPEQLQLGAP